MIKQEIKKILSKVLQKKEISLENISVDYSADAKHGDYSTNIAFIAAKKIGKNPMELAEEIAQEIKNEQGQVSFEKVEVARPGFINFRVKNEVFIDSLQQIDDGHNYASLVKKKILVEYAHPNTHKEMHIGHMRTLITGEALSRLLEAIGADVFRANYQGDIGPHVAKAIVGMQELIRAIEKEQGKDFNEILDEIRIWSHKDKAHFLGKGYAEGVKLYEKGKMAKQIDETNAFLYQKCSAKEIISSFLEEEQEKLWNLYQETRQWSLDYYDEFYQRFYTHFNHLFFESQMVAEGLNIVLDNVGKVFEKSEDTIIFPGEKYGLHTRVFITAKGYPTYEGKEMGNAYTEYQTFPFDRKIHVVANEQAGYFKVVFKALELINPEKFAGKQEHLSMGMVQLKDRKMSSRTGDILTVDWLINQIEDRVESMIREGRIAAEEKDKTVEQIVIGAVKYSVLKVGTTQDVAFDIESSISLDGNSGPYLQYSYARTQSVLGKAKNRGEKVANTIIISSEEREVLRLLARFSEIVAEAAVRYSPHLLCTYLFDLAQVFNLFYQKFPILKAEGEARDFRLQLTAHTGATLKQGLNLLGIQAPERM
ncbi:MAG TPA: arginine--tRNA ligase [Candidatus Sulfotelmatobacter sp.]|jgi:arginyl-tRNA synthetase|nr:arginine--tRNA ligase [Candidatus Sulfotelmatobacter sp.]